MDSNGTKLFPSDCETTMKQIVNKPVFFFTLYVVNADPVQLQVAVSMVWPGWVNAVFIAYQSSETYQI